MNDILGTAATITSIIYLCFGIPVQIVKNYKRKSTEGLSLFFMSFCSITLVLWTLYSVTKTPKDYYILSSNLPGLIFSLILLSQFWTYRKKT